jgi:multiple antibiotic resistance protein
VSELSKFLGLTFSALLPLVNPLGSSLMFLSVAGSAPPAVYKTLARKIAITSTIFLLAVQLVGTAVLKFFGISLPVVQVAGGLTLAAMGWNLLNQDKPENKKKEAEAEGGGLGSLEQKVFYPFTFPITAGPGCIVVMVTLSAHATVKGVLPDIAAHAGIAIAVMLLCVAVYFCYANAPLITARVPQQTAHGILRVIAFFLLCIGVQITWNGLEVMLKGLLGKT